MAFEIGNHLLSGMNGVHVHGGKELPAVGGKACPSCGGGGCGGSCGGSRPVGRAEAPDHAILSARARALLAELEAHDRGRVAGVAAAPAGEPPGIGQELPVESLDLPPAPRPELAVEADREPATAPAAPAPHPGLAAYTSMAGEPAPPAAPARLGSPLYA